MLTNSPITVVLPAADLERAKHFYTDKLGLKEVEFSPSEGGVMFECGGGTKLFIYQKQIEKPEFTQAHFEVTDLIAEMAELRAKGVNFEDFEMPGLKTENGIAEMKGYKSAWFKDTEGNIIALGQTVQP